MSGGKDFFRLLREKTEVTPDAAFDRRFRERLLKETAPAPTRPGWRGLPWRWLAPALVPLAVALVVWQVAYHNDDTREILAVAPVLWDMELLGEGDAEGVDYSALTEDEWRVLLEGS